MVLVPCPGADPLQTWLGEAGEQHWATESIKKRAPCARVLVYDYGDIEEGWTFKNLATQLLRLLYEQRPRKGTDVHLYQKRPVFFICHSIGGLVVKLALTEAHRHERYRPIADFCHGVTFFATPHHGSFHLSTDDFRLSVQEMLYLRAPLPVSLTKQLSLENKTLQKIDENFKQLAGEFQLWTFYETEDSVLLPSSNVPGTDRTPDTAPITPMSSAILGVRHEKIYALRSTHAECAWFDGQDEQTMWIYLRSLCDTILEAARIHRRYRFNPEDRLLHPKDVESEVSVEVHGFYEHKNLDKIDPVIRMLFIKQSLQRFLSWGPDGLLEQRLVDRQPLGHDYGPMVGRGLTIGRTFVFRDPEMDDGELSPGESRPARGKYLGQKGRAPDLDPSQNILEEASPAPTQRPSVISEDSIFSDKPVSEDKKFDWIHVPFNNPIWVEKVFETLSVNDKINYVEVFGAPHWGSRHSKARHPQHHACFLKPTCGTVPFQSDPIQDCRYLYFPYLHFDSYKSVIRRRNLIKKRLDQGRANPVPAWVLKEGSLELKLIWTFLGHDPPINCRRTLDQYQYPSIHDTRARDDDQVLYKLTKEQLHVGLSTVKAGNEEGDETPREEDDVLNGNLLMVDQLWMWILGTPDHRCKYSISCYSKCTRSYTFVICEETWTDCCGQHDLSPSTRKETDHQQKVHFLAKRISATSYTTI